MLDNFRTIVSELGGDPEALLADADVSRISPSGEIDVISSNAIGELLEKTAETLNCPDLGLRLAAKQNYAMLVDPLNQLLYNAPTIGDMLRCSVEHRTAYGSRVLLSLEYDAEQAMTAEQFEIVDSFSLYPQLTEQLALLAHNAVIHLSTGFARSRMVWFSHLRLSSPAVYARRFGVQVKFGQEYNGIFFSDADLKTKTINGDASIFASEARAMAKRFPTLQPDVGMQVRRQLYRTMATSPCSRQGIAETLGLQERTLNRRLRALGTSFEMIRDQVRRDLTIRYLARGDLSVTEIAARLGYSELAVLSRSCRRWFNEAPRELQRRLAPG